MKKFSLDKRAVLKLLFFMNLKIFFLFICIMPASASIYSQNTKLDVSVKNYSLERVFEQIENQSEFTFLYSVDDIDDYTNISIDIKGESVEEILEKCLENTSLTYEIEDKLVVVRQKEHAVTPKVGSQEKKEVKGTVIDEKGEGLPGVNVVVKGTVIGTSTDIDGNFTIEVDNLNETLVFSFIGFLSKEVKIDNNTNISVVLYEDTENLSEVVVVGYGVQKKANLTGSVTSVKPDQLVAKPSTTLSAALQGTMPGVSVVQESGQPGADGGTIRIRGLSSLDNNAKGPLDNDVNGPLVIVDGIPSSIDDVDVNDIESMSVLKDAASTSIYGTRGGNGVILITTKNGKGQKMQVSLNSYVAWQSPTNLPEFVSSADYAKYKNIAAVNDGKEKLFTDEQIKKYADGSDPDNYPNTDWVDLLYQGSGFQQSHHVALKGGDEINSFMLSVNYKSQEGIIDNTSNDKYGVRFNLNSKPYERLETGINFSFNRADFEEPSNPYTGGFYQVIRQTYKLNSTITHKYSDGNYGYGSDGNPIAWIDQGSVGERIRTRALGKLYANLNVADNLYVRGEFAMNYFVNDESCFTKDIQYYGFGTGDKVKYQGPNKLEDKYYRHTKYTSRVIVNYNKTIKEDHTIGLMAGIEREDYRFDENEMMRKGFPSNALFEINAGPETGQTMEGWAKETALLSYFGRINYSYKDKYLFEANIRRDGSSSLADGHRWGNFPSFSAAWRLSEEDFIKDTDFHNLKLRASWGQSGNPSGAGAYSAYDRMFVKGGYPLGGSMVAGIGYKKDVEAGNPLLSWETITMWNIGVDAGLLDGKLNITADYFDKLTEDIILEVPISQTFGLKAPKQNSASVSNKGLELAIDYNNKIGDLSYNVGLNMTFINQQVEKLDGYATERIDGSRIDRIGSAMNSYYGWKAIGYFDDADELANSAKRTGSEKLGDLRFEDINNDGKIDDDDKVILGDAMPEISFGMNLGLNYKDFDFMMVLQGAANYEMNYRSESASPLYGGNNIQQYQTDFWTPDNKNAANPRLSGGATNLYNSSFFVHDASYLRLKNIQLGYSLPKSILEKWNVEKVRFYVSGQNLLTIADVPEGFDPEMPSGNGAKYPQVKVYSFGVNVNF